LASWRQSVPLESLYIRRNSTSFGQTTSKFNLKKKVGKWTEIKDKKKKKKIEVLDLSLSLLC